MKHLRLLPLLLLALALSLFVISAQDDLPDEIIIDVPALQPEGIEYDAANGRFLVGSLLQGTIFSVADDGTTEPFIEDEDFMATVGIHIDTENERLLVPNSSTAAFTGQETDGPQILLGAYDLNTGERIFMTDLTGLASGPFYFGNDVTVDADGNAYLTDSVYPGIYVVTLEGEASVFLEDEAFISEQFGLNGIDYHPDGYLLVALAGEGAIFKVPVDAPTDFTMVELDVPVSIDGMVVNEDGTVVYAVGRIDGTQFVVEITSEDDWTTASVTNQVETGGNATTLALRDGEVYFVNAYLNDPAAEQYEIIRAVFDVEEEAASVEEELPEGCEPGICLADPAEACQCELCGVACPADGDGNTSDAGDSADSSSDVQSGAPDTGTGDGSGSAPTPPTAEPPAAPPVAPPPATTEEAG